MAKTRSRPRNDLKASNLEGRAMQRGILSIMVWLALASGQACAEDQGQQYRCKASPSAISHLAASKKPALRLEGVSCSKAYSLYVPSLYHLSPTGDLALVEEWSIAGDTTYQYKVGGSWSAKAPTALIPFDTQGRPLSAFIWNQSSDGILAAVGAPTATQILRISQDGKIERLQEIARGAARSPWVGHGDALFSLREDQIEGGRSAYHLDIVRGSDPTRLESLDLGSSVRGLTLRDANLGEDGRARAILSGPDHDWLYWGEGALPRKLNLAIGTMTAWKDAWVVRLSSRQEGMLVTYRPGETSVTCEEALLGCYGSPRLGKIAEYVDLKKGRSVWAIRGTTTQSDAFIEPTFSPDGRTAIVGVPGVKRSSRLAYIDLKTGASLGVISFPSEPGDLMEDNRRPKFSATAGFSRNGAQVWVSNGRSVVHYGVVERR